MIKAILFDIDGVIFESEEIHYEVEAETLTELGFSVTKEFIREHYSGVRLDQEFLDISKRFNRPISYSEAVKIRDRILTERTKNGFPLVPYAQEIIKELSNNYLLAVASSGEKRFMKKALETAGILQYFNAQVFGEDIEKPKPSPDAFLKAAKALGVNPNECLVVEDSPSGFEAAKSAGMILVARKAEHNQQRDFSIADYVIEDLRDIPAIVLGLNSMVAS